MTATVKNSTFPNNTKIKLLITSIMLKLIRQNKFLNSRIFRHQISCGYCYKPIKRAPKNDIQRENKYLKNKFNEISLTKKIEARIKMSGPISVADYMREILTNPNDGYYMTKDVFGREGDFITSPEINQIFGEIISIWCVLEWEKIGSPKPLQLIELGPGRGTLSQDILKIFAKFNLSRDISLHLVEISPFLSKLQSQKLCYQSTEVESDIEHPYYRIGETITGTKVYWYRRIEDIPNGFSIVLANEFFDALPINIFQKNENNKWREILIDVDTTQPEKFIYVKANCDTLNSNLFSHLISPNDARAHIEFSFESNIIIEYLAKRFTEYGGIGLIIDYGHLGTKTDTFRSFRNHELHDPLIDPGTADLTSDVDFARMKTQCETNTKLITFGPITQADFLKNMKADLRLQVLLQNVEGQKKEMLNSGYDMLTNREKMGERFKFFSIFPNVLKDHLEKFPVHGFQ